jgi:hypothetical protein
MGGKIVASTSLFPFWLPLWFVFVCFALLFAVLTPPFMYPDEPTHLVGCLETLNPAARERMERDVLELMAELHFWERAGVESPTELPEKFYQAPLLRIVPTQASKPLLFYQTSGRLVRLFGAENILVSLFLLRIWGVFLAAISVAIFGRISEEVFTEKVWQAGAMAIVFVPQFAYMAGAVNPMTTAWITGGMLILSGLWLLKPDRRCRGWLLGLAAFTIAPVTHPSALALAPLCLLAVVLGRKRLQRHKIPWWIWPATGIVTAAGFWGITLVKPIFVRSILLRTAELIHGLRIFPGTDRTGVAWFMQFGRWFWRSSIVNFGWLTLEGPEWIYLACSVVCLVSIGGWLLVMIKQKTPVIISDSSQILVLLTGFIFMFLAATGPYYLRHNLSQGRYLFPAWPIIGVLTAVGLSVIVPCNLRRFFVGLIIAISCFICSWSLILVLIKGFYF